MIDINKRELNTYTIRVSINVRESLVNMYSTKISIPIETLGY